MTERWSSAGIDPARLVLVEFNPSFCRLLRTRYPDATVVQGDAYASSTLLGGLLQRAGRRGGVGPAAVHQAAQACGCAFDEAFALMAPGAPFVQFTYAMVPPIPKALDRVPREASERIWMNIPPARVWVYRKD